MGINGKVVSSMFVVVLSTMLTVALYSHSMTKNILVDQVEQELAAKNENVRNAVSAVFRQKGEVVRQLAKTPVIESFMGANESKENVRSNKDYEWVQQTLTRTKEYNADAQMVWLSNVRNSYFIGDNNYMSEASYSIEKRRWYKQIVNMESHSFSSPFEDHITKKSTISIIYPVIVNSRKLGYAGMYIPLDEFAKLIQPLEKDGRKLILVTDQGDVLYDSENMWPAFQKENLEEKGNKKIEKGQKSYYASVSELDGLDWKIGVYVPEEVVLQPLTTYEKAIIIAWIAAIVILLTILSFVLHYLLKDIPYIVRKINRIKDGNLDVKIGIKRKDEVGEIARAVEQMALQIKSQVDKLDYQASHDSLTGLANRHSIESVFQQWLDEMDVEEEIMTVSFLDLDQFKHINDSKGHAFGDELLIKVGERIEVMLSDNSFFGRFGGDEFILIMRAKKDEVDPAYDFLQRVHESFSIPFQLFDQNVYVTASMGISLYPYDALTIGELFVAADTALYHSKEQGRNCIHFFNHDMKKQIAKEIQLKNGLRFAIANEEFFLHYQPQVDVGSGEMVGVEALIRWKHPELGMVPPSDFIPLVENTGQIIELGDWVLDATLQMIKRIAKEGVCIPRVAVNVSALQLNEADFVDKIRRKLDYYDVEPSLLEIEITESVIINHREETIQKLLELRELGIRIALDDFGTGYSSLNYLRIMPIDRLKVDRSFIDQVEEDNVAQSILQTIITLGHSLAFQIVAEGVENEMQLKILRDMNVDIVQGYYYSKPLDEEKLVEFSRKMIKSPSTY